MVLVVDPESLRVISSSIGMYNLMEHHVSIVENLMKKRAPFKDQCVIYLVEPKGESVRKVIEDWTPCRERKGPLYGNTVFLYFLGRLNDDLFTEIKGCKELVKRIKVLKEVNLDFLIKDAQSYHFDMKHPSLYSELYLSNNANSTLQDDMMSKLVTVCATLNEYPHVRYPANNSLCKQLAFLFQQKMNEFVGSNREWWYNGDGLHPNSERATLLLLDRKDDCLSPLVHEFTYEAMVNDLLPIDDDRITYESVNAGTAREGSQEATTKMDALLNDNDEVWVELRGKHIADVIQTLSNKIREIVDSSSGSALSKSAKANGKALSLNQMAKALKALPEYREIMSKLSQHMQIAHQCMDAFGSQGLLELSELEQTLATGKTDEGKSPKLKQLLGMTVEEFRKQPNSLMRLRLMAIVIVSQRGLGSESDLQKLLGEASLSSKELSALRNLEKLGCPLVQRKSADTKGKLVGFLKSKGVETFTQAESDSEYSSSRYVCLLKPILEQAAAGKLSVDQYPSVMPLPDAEAVLGQSASGAAKSVRKAGTASSKWQSQSTASNASVKKKTSYSGRQIVFMAGGMCYSELRSAREVMNASGTEIVVGGTRFITPKDFLIDLNNLG
jgi:syntaxin-binding protein 1